MSPNHGTFSHEKNIFFPGQSLSMKQHDTLMDLYFFVIAFHVTFSFALPHKQRRLIKPFKGDKEEIYEGEKELELIGAVPIQMTLILELLSNREEEGKGKCNLEGFR